MQINTTEKSGLDRLILGDLSRQWVYTVVLAVPHRSENVADT
jgi:hypothetical protein